MKQQSTEQRLTSAPSQPSGRRDLDPVGLATLAGVIGILMISFASMRDVDRLDRSLEDRIGKLENQIAQVGTRAPQNAAAPQAGPDPNRVYTIKLASDTPVRGRVSAPVTIAEFSDFQ